MLTQVCQYLRNWFTRDIYTGSFTISGGVLTFNGKALPLLINQYYRIIGSVLNDGVHKNDGSHDLVDESFTGAVWSMAVPPDFLELVSDIGSWCENNAEALNSPYQSESFGGYSYSLKSGNGGGSENTGLTWQSQFASQLAPWRKI